MHCMKCAKHIKTCHLCGWCYDCHTELKHLYQPSIVLDPNVCYTASPVEMPIDFGSFTTGGTGFLPGLGDALI